MTHLMTFTLVLLLSSLTHLTAGEDDRDMNTFVVDLKVVVDSVAIRKWRESTGKVSHEDFKQELMSLFVEVGELYKSLRTYHHDVKFVLKELILNAPDVVKATNGQINTLGLPQFREWLTKDKPFNKTDYDIALLFTGNDVVRETRGYLGFGNIGGICTEKAVGMIELTSITYRIASVTAHEMGHILGMQHDGFEKKPGSECSAKDGYIMAPGTTVLSKNNRKFSDCSYLYIYQKLYSLPWECLEVGGKAEDAITGDRMGELISADDMCSREMGKGSTLNREKYWVYGDEVCSSMECVNPSKQYRDIYTPQGLYCGKNKQCIGGKCVKTDNGKPDVSDECPFGDQPSIDYKGYKTCNDLPLEECGVMKIVCCERCNLKEIGWPDQACRLLEHNPKAMMYRRAYAGYSQDTVCEWLACTTGYKSQEGGYQWRWKRSPPGMICGQNKRCVGTRCLPSTNANGDIPDVCPFGDIPYLSHNRQSCQADIKGYKPYNACIDDEWKYNCCASCQ